MLSSNENCSCKGPVAGDSMTYMGMDANEGPGGRNRESKGYGQDLIGPKGAFSLS